MDCTAQEFHARQASSKGVVINFVGGPAIIDISAGAGIGCAAPAGVPDAQAYRQMPMISQAEREVIRAQREETESLNQLGINLDDPTGSLKNMIERATRLSKMVSAVVDRVWIAMHCTICNCHDTSSPFSHCLILHQHTQQYLLPR